MKEFLWGKIIPKTIILALTPVLIGILGSIAVTYHTFLWIISTIVFILLYVLYLIGNCRYELSQKSSKVLQDATTKLCREDCSLIKSFADSLHKKINQKIGHAEIENWEILKNHCDNICKIIYEFIQSVSLKGEQFSVSVFFKRTVDGNDEFKMISRVSYDNHNPASYDVFKTADEIKNYYYYKIFAEKRTRPSILSTKSEIQVAFYNCDGVNYSQYVGIPVACLGNKMIALLQIVSYNDSVIAKDTASIQKLVDDYLCTYANLILLADKVENAIHYLS